MIRVICERLRQGKRTIRYPQEVPRLPDRFRGLPEIRVQHCSEECVQAMLRACPVGALRTRERSEGSGGSRLQMQMDLGRCIFCGACEEVCSHGGVRFTREYRLAARTRSGLMFSGAQRPHVEALVGKAGRLFKRAFTLRHVSAGGCNACEADTNVLATVVYDLSRFGIHFAASPRHADGMIISGPVTRNMEDAVRLTYEAIAPPKVVIAVGACAISGGIYYDHDEVCKGADQVVPVDLYIPGCPPHPLTILDGLLQLLGRSVPDR